MIQINKIHTMDCLIGLKNIESNTIDLCITSPPYNLGNDHHTGNKRHNPYNDDLPEDEYQEMQIQVLSEIFRVLKPTGSLFYNHKNRIKKGKQITPYEWILKTPFTVKQEIVWVNRSQNFDKIRFYPWTERVYWMTKSPSTKLVNNINHCDVFDWNEWKPVGTKGGHKRAFPEQMVRDIIQCFPDAKIVLDPYVGSGTVAVVAKEMGLDYIGFDITPEYVEMASQRIAEQANQVSLLI